MKNKQLINVLLGVIENNNSKGQSPFEVGKKYFIRTVTYHCVGEVSSRSGNFLTLKNASWVADSGRLSDALSRGFSEQAEIEPAGQMIVNEDAICDAFEWSHSLPKEQQ